MCALQAARILAEFVAVAPQEYDEEAKNNATGKCLCMCVFMFECGWVRLRASCVRTA